MVDAARASLRAAFVRAGLPAMWQEWDQLSPDAPARVLGFGSPAILVNGRDVTGDDTRSPGLACRAGGAATSETILAALRRSAGPHP